MKKLLFVILILSHSFGAHAQSDFFFNLYGGSTNMWSSIFLQFPTSLINSFITSAIDDDDAQFNGGQLRYQVFRVRNEQGKMNMDKGTYYGFKSKDMFSNVQYGLKFGWQPELSPFGLYVSLGYQFNKFSLQMDSNINEWTKFKIHCLKPGIGIRITPFINMLREDDWSPILEVGTSYNYHMGMSGSFSDDKNQLNNGIASNFAIGARFNSYSLTGGVEIDHFSLFNKDFKAPNGNMPFKDVSTSNLYVYIAASHDF